MGRIDTALHRGRNSWGIGIRLRLGTIWTPPADTSRYSGCWANSVASPGGVPMCPSPHMGAPRRPLTRAAGMSSLFPLSGAGLPSGAPGSGVAWSACGPAELGWVARATGSAGGVGGGGVTEVDSVAGPPQPATANRTAQGIRMPLCNAIGAAVYSLFNKSHEPRFGPGASTEFNEVGVQCVGKRARRLGIDHLDPLSRGQRRPTKSTNQKKPRT